MNGRIVLIGDVNAFGNYMNTDDNARLGLNIANYLVAGGSEVLVYTNEPLGEAYWTGKDFAGIQTPVGKLRRR